MQAAFDLPVRTEHVQQLVRRGLFCGQAGNAVDDLMAGFSSFADRRLALQFEAYYRKYVKQLWYITGQYPSEL